MKDPYASDDQGEEPLMGYTETLTKPPVRKPRKLPRLLANKDWWSFHLGLLCLTIIMLVALVGKYTGLPAGPAQWTGSPLDAWPSERIYVTLVMCPVIWIFNVVAYCVIESAQPVAKQTRGKDGFAISIPAYACNFGSSLALVMVLAVLAWWVAEQTEIHRYGLTFEVWGLVFGMIVANTRRGKLPHYIGLASKGEDYIKVGLVLLGLDVQTIGELAGPGFITSWLVTPIVIVFAYAFAAKVLGFSNKHGDFTASLGMMLSVGLAVCGSSAATAIHSAISEQSAPKRDEELTLTICILNVFTMVQMIAWPYVAWAAGVPKATAGGWFGGSIDGTGNVVASGAIFDELIEVGNSTVFREDRDGFACVEIASTVKMIQNAMIGPVAIVVTLYWMVVVESKDPSITTPKAKKSCWTKTVEVWDRFPKFVLGFVVASIALTIAKQHSEDETSVALERLLISVRSWWFTIGFVGVGMSTHIPSLYKKLKGGKALYLYLVGQTFDLVITFAVSYLSFHVLWKGQFD